MSRGLSVNIPNGQYIVAVSGGVDSVTLLDLLLSQPGLKLTVAHFDHGIRPDSKLDREFVQELAKKHNLPFVYDEANLGPNASEAIARKARYQFLDKARLASDAQSVITAHHQDDQLETVIFNIMRGTGRKGLSSLQSTELLIRPLLNTRKATIYDYAKDHNLCWREDTSNQDIKYSRNYIRHQIIPKLTESDQQKLLSLINDAAKLNCSIDQEINEYMRHNLDQAGLNRPNFIKLPHALSNEIMASWLRINNIRGFNANLLDNLTIAAKTLRPGQLADVNAAYFLQVQKDKLALVGRDR